MENIFERIRKVNKHGMEYWSARELYKLLGYTEYGKFIPAIERAQESCKNSSQSVVDHFAHVSEMIKIATGTEKETSRKIEDYHLSRYACYLIAQNGDPRKEEIALAQTYFALQTRKQELSEQLVEDGKRVEMREDIKYRTYRLNNTLCAHL